MKRPVIGVGTRGIMKHTRTLRGQISLVLIALVTVAVLIAVTSMVLRSGAGSVEAMGASDTFKVRRGGFDITLPVSGELAALRQIEIRNNVDGRAVITDIVAEGSWVKAGDVVLRLNDEELRNKEREARERVIVAEAALTSAQSKLTLEKNARKLAVDLAELALKAWQEGEAKTKLKELEVAVETAKKEQTRLAERYLRSIDLEKKQFISKDELQQDEIANLNANFDVLRAENELMVYKDYQIAQDKAQKESDLEQARIEREAEIRTAESEVDSKKLQLDSAKEELAELQQQLAYCVVTAPAPGLVVYYASTQMGGMGRNEGRPPQVGTELARNEQVIILPDTSQMVAAVKISEALVGQIQAGQHATITCDALPDVSLTGTVQSVGVLAESGGWRDPNRRDYTVRILLHEGAEMGLKPSMRCKATIHVGRVNDALHVPIQAVFRTGPLAYVYVPENNGFAQRKVTTGRASELYIEVLDGVAQDETVLLRQPQPEEIVSRLPAPKQEQQPGAMNGPANGPMPTNAPSMNGGNGMSGPGAMTPGNGGRPQMTPANGPGMNSGDGMRPEGGTRPDGSRRGNRGSGGQRPDGAPRPEGGESTGGGGSPSATPSPTTGEQPAKPQ